MKKLTTILFGLFLALCALAQNTNTTDNGVVINGVKWATRNVDAPGTFAKNPEDAGMFYQWNRRVGWSATDPMINSDGGTDWDNTDSEGIIWKKSNDPSPAGWRVPTVEELRTLLEAEKVTNEWTTQNGVIGRKFTDKATSNSLFFPAVGYRSLRTGEFRNAGTNGVYWSSTLHESGETGPYYLSSGKGTAGVGYYSRMDGFAVRCVFAE